MKKHMDGILAIAAEPGISEDKALQSTTVNKLYMIVLMTRGMQYARTDLKTLLKKQPGKSE